MAKILVTDGMDKNAAIAMKELGHEIVEEFYELDVLKEKVKEADAIIVRSKTKIRKDVIDSAKAAGRLKLIVRAGVGVDNIDVQYAKDNGIEVRNTPSASSASVAELAIAHMFAISRFIPAANVTMRNGEWNKKAYKGSELGGKTLGVIGFGRIGIETAKRAKALGMNIIYTDFFGKKDGYDEFKYVEKDELIKNADYITLHVPFIKENGPVLTKKEFAQMKDGVYLVNCARGGVVCEAALLDALETGKVAAAGIDVFEEEPTKNEKLINHSNVSVTPHIGASTKEAQKRIGEELVEIVKTVF
jgi:D-3-phosphoglycerate dehydrogenase